MREAKLVVVFHQRTGIDHQPQLGAILWLVVLADIVGDAIGELADRGPGIQWQTLVQRNGEGT
jgi:hypothetical protein